MPIWDIFDTPLEYEATILAMNKHVKDMQDANAQEAIWLLSHQAVYTGGTSARDGDILQKTDVPFIETGRGGQWTYHDEGMRIVYPLLNLNRRQADLRLYVHSLEAWIIDILACFAIKGERRDGLPGVWVHRNGQYDKIAALGVRVSKWVSAHGFAINLAPNLAAFDAIVPCGVSDGGTTSLVDLGHDVSQAELDMAIKDCFKNHFGDNMPMGLR